MERPSDLHLKNQVRAICKDVGSARKKRKNDLYTEYLKEIARKPPAQFHAVLPRPDVPGTSSSVARISQTTGNSDEDECDKPRKKVYGQQAVRVLVTSSGESHPPFTMYRPLQKNHSAQDEKLVFIPFLDEGHQDTSKLLAGHDLDDRLKRVEQGPEIHHESWIQIFEQCSNIPFAGDTVWMDDSARRLVLATIAQAFHQKTSVLEDAHKTWSKRTDDATEDAENRVKLVPIEPYDMFDQAYVEALDSYRALYCRRCYIYYCNVHHDKGWIKPCLTFQYRLTKAVEESWKSFVVADVELDRNMRELSAKKITRLIDRARLSGKSGLMALMAPNRLQVSFDGITELSTFQKVLCKRLFLIFDGNFDHMANALRAPKRLLIDFIEENKISLPDEIPAPLPKPKKNLNHFSIANYNPKWYKAIGEAEINNLFIPCVHPEICSEESCTCIESKVFCTKACCWGAASPNFFRGCNCKGGCGQNSCTCFAMRRECDPDICGCDTCSDPAGKPTTKQICRNDNLRMKRKARLHIGRSEVSNWGLFTKCDLKKGDYIDEYIGEIVTQPEAERRGQIDDAKNSTYMFNLSADASIDANRKGGKTRFINHSFTPNIEPKTLFVDGDQRIAFFAIKDIPAQSELFFNYRLHVTMKNDLIEKSAKSFAWCEPINENDAEPEKSVSKRRRLPTKNRKRAPT